MSDGVVRGHEPQRGVWACVESCTRVAGAPLPSAWYWTNSHRSLQAPETSPWWQAGKEALPGV